MATNLIVTLTPTGNPNEYILALPDELQVRSTIVSRGTAAEIENTLVAEEIGYQEDTNQLVLKTGGVFRRWNSSS